MENPFSNLILFILIVFAVWAPGIYLAEWQYRGMYRNGERPNVIVRFIYGKRGRWAVSLVGTLTLFAFKLWERV